MVKSLQGKPKSGKPWKIGSKPFISLDNELKDSLPKKNYQKRLEEKKQIQDAKDYEKEIKDAKALIKQKKI